jgi:hypothetical protein
MDFDEILRRVEQCKEGYALLHSKLVAAEARDYVLGKYHEQLCSTLGLIPEETSWERLIEAFKLEHNYYLLDGHDDTKKVDEVSVPNVSDQYDPDAHTQSIRDIVFGGCKGGGWGGEWDEIGDALKEWRNTIHKAASFLKTVHPCIECGCLIISDHTCCKRCGG